jgi:hypothetical protein
VHIPIELHASCKLGWLQVRLYIITASRLNPYDTHNTQWLAWSPIARINARWLNVKFKLWLGYSLFVYCHWEMRLWIEFIQSKVARVSCAFHSGDFNFYELTRKISNISEKDLSICLNQSSIFFQWLHILIKYRCLKYKFGLYRSVIFSSICWQSTFLQTKSYWRLQSYALCYHNSCVIHVT